jgi:anaerobic selenocysteine-containing dehydrogenase
VQQKAVDDKVHEKYPIVLTSGRLVEYEGGGDETRSNPWLAELQQENFVEINTKDAEKRGIKYWDFVWVSTRRARASRCGRWSPSASAPAPLHPVPLRGLVAGQGPARQVPGGIRTRSCAARR